MGGDKEKYKYMTRLLSPYVYAIYLFYFIFVYY